MSSTSSRKRFLATLAAATMLGLAACGTPSASNSASSTTPASSASSATQTRTTYPLTIDNCGTKQTFKQAPQRVVILNGASVGEVESLLVLDLDTSIIGNAQSYGVSDDPSMVERIKKVPTGGLTANKNFDVPAEQVLALKPDLVISTWSGGFNAKMGFASREQLTAAGINSLVNPVNCAFGKPDATADEKATYAKASVSSTFEFLTLLGEVFDVQAKAAQTVTSLKDRIAAVESKVANAPAKSVLVAFPGMSAMTSTGMPAVFAGGIYDDVLAKAGGKNAFAGKDAAFLRSINAEALTAAKVDLLAVGSFSPSEKPDADAAKLFTTFPGWQASKDKAFVAVSDGIYLGPSNVFAIEKLAKALHPQAF